LFNAAHFLEPEMQRRSIMKSTQPRLSQPRHGTTVRLKGVDAAERGTLRGDNATAVMRTLVNGELTVT